jgi:stage II sporulation protein D
MNKMQGYDFRPNGKYITVKINGEWQTLPTDNIVIKPDIDGFVSVKKKWYRGFLRIVNSGAGITVINDVELEKYLLGVVPSEMPPAWELDAHKAQAIAARSYAVANLGKRAKYGYDLNDTEADQVYNGASAETAQTNSAVEETSGIVLICNNKVIPAYYSASAGGRTLSAKQVWKTDAEFTHSVPSFDDNVKKKGHGVGMSQHGANNLAKQGYNAYQILQYFYQNIKFAKLDSES